jgi:hypothetical protein
VTNYLLPVASHWGGSWVACRFKALADGKPLATADDTQPLYEIPNGTSEVHVTMTPTSPLYWERTVILSVSTSGVISPKGDSSTFVRLRTVATSASRGTVVKIQVSRFKDVTAYVLGLLQIAPTTRHIKNEKTGKFEDVPVPDEAAKHVANYGAWPPKDWNLHDAPNAHFLDVAALESGVLNFAKNASLKAVVEKVESVVLQLNSRKAPQLFAVTWPKAIVRTADAAPTQFLLFIRQGDQGNHYDWKGLFVGGELKPYPFNFDYADSGLFESLHFAVSPLVQPGMKGVPYQVAKAGAKVVTVLPCNSFEEEFGVLAKTEETGKILLELQAFMFWKAGVSDPPQSIGKTALAAFSSGNDFLNAWLKNTANLRGDFLSKTVSAVYFLDPRPNLVPDCVVSAQAWANRPGNQDKRIRLYTHQSLDPSDRARVLAAHKKLLGSEPPPAPYAVNSSPHNTRTISMVRYEDVTAAFIREFHGAPNPPIGFSYTHHLIAATMLTHALAQKDFDP